MPDRVRSGSLRPALVQLALAVLVLAAVGVLAGAVWAWLWSPPDGAVVDGVWVARDEDSLREVFAGTGWYVVVASVAGVLGGAVVALFLDRFPLVTLAGVVLGSGIAAFVMARVGVALESVDTEQGDLAVTGASPYIALPAGALVALALVFIGLMAKDRVKAG